MKKIRKRIVCVLLSIVMACSPIAGNAVPAHASAVLPYAAYSIYEILVAFGVIILGSAVVWKASQIDFAEVGEDLKTSLDKFRIGVQDLGEQLGDLAGADWAPPDPDVQAEWNDYLDALEDLICNAPDEIEVPPDVMAQAEEIFRKSGGGMPDKNGNDKKPDLPKVPKNLANADILYIVSMLKERYQDFNQFLDEYQDGVRKDDDITVPSTMYAYLQNFVADHVVGETYYTLEGGVKSSGAYTYYLNSDGTYSKKTLKLTTGAKHLMIVGNPIGNGRHTYSLFSLDPDDEGAIYTVSVDFENTCKDYNVMNTEANPVGHYEIRNNLREDHSTVNGKTYTYYSSGYSYEDITSWIYGYASAENQPPGSPYPSFMVVRDFDMIGEGRIYNYLDLMKTASFHKVSDSGIYHFDDKEIPYKVKDLEKVVDKFAEGTPVTPDELYNASKSDAPYMTYSEFLELCKQYASDNKYKLVVLENPADQSYEAYFNSSTFGLSNPSGGKYYRFVVSGYKSRYIFSDGNYKTDEENLSLKYTLTNGATVDTSSMPDLRTVVYANYKLYFGDVVIFDPADPPVEKPTEAPTEAPTESPTESPSESPSESPVEPPTEAPTEAPDGEDDMSDPEKWKVPLEFKNKFPFSIPWDVYYCLKILKADAKEPVWELPFVVKTDSIDIQEKVVLDLSTAEWSGILSLIRAFLLLLYIIGLVLVTRTLIKG